MVGYHTNIEKSIGENENFRQVLFTGQLIQLVAMSLKPGEDTGLETYLDTELFICIEQGSGKAILDGLEYELSPGTAIVIQVETEFIVINTSATQALKLCIIYIPPDYDEDTIRTTNYHFYSTLDS